jgi:hypothetical protein
MFNVRIRVIFLVGLFSCGFWLPADAQWLFEYRTAPVDILYDVATGEGSGSASISLVELPTSYGFPNPVWSWSLSIGHDPTLLEPFDVAQGSSIQGINNGNGPDFWAIGIEPDGIFIGTVYSLTSSANGYYETPEEIAVVYYQTVVATLAGDLDGETTTLFALEVGNPPVENLVVVDVPGPTQSAYPDVLDGIVTLVPGLQLVRGDANGNGSIEPLADAIVTLYFLFVSGSSVTCLDALDCNDDAAVNLSDPILLLTWGFAMGSNLPAPFPECGSDPTDDLLSCDGSGCP